MYYAFNKFNCFMNAAAVLKAFRYLFSTLFETFLFDDPCNRLQNIIFSC